MKKLVVFFYSFYLGYFFNISNSHAKGYLTEGAYLDLGVGSGLFFVISPFKDFSDDFYTDTSSFWGVGGNVSLGYMITPYIGLEIGYFIDHVVYKEANDYYYWDKDGNYVYEEKTIKESINLYSVPIAVKYAIPLICNTAILLKIGVQGIGAGGYIFPPIFPYTGIGFSYTKNKYIDFNLMYQGAIGVVANVGLLSAGITMHF